MKKNKKILKQALLISCTVLLSLQNVSACTYGRGSVNAANAAAGNIATEAETAATEAEAAATAAENAANALCPTTAVCYDDWVSEVTDQQDIATAQKTAANVALTYIKDHKDDISCEKAKEKAQEARDAATAAKTAADTAATASDTTPTKN